MLQEPFILFHFVRDVWAAGGVQKGGADGPRRGGQVGRITAWPKYL